MEFEAICQYLLLLPFLKFFALFFEMCVCVVPFGVDWIGSLPG